MANKDPKWASTKDNPTGMLTHPVTLVQTFSRMVLEKTSAIGEPDSYEGTQARLMAEASFLSGMVNVVMEIRHALRKASKDPKQFDADGFYTSLRAFTDTAKLTAEGTMMLMLLKAELKDLDSE